MPEISIDNAKPGMVVTEQVANDKGMVLLPAGTVLNEVLIARLKKWNVTSVNYQGGGEADTGSTEAGEIFSTPEIDAALEKHLEEKFKPVMDDPIMAVLYKAIKIYYNNIQAAKQAGQGGKA
jgi:hypothetical protein